MLTVHMQPGLQGPAFGRVIDASANLVNSNQPASSSTSAAPSVPVLSLSSMAAINKVSLSIPLPSARATPRQHRFQMDGDMPPPDTDHGHDALGSADAEAQVPSISLSTVPTWAGQGDAKGTVGLSQSSPESKQSVLDSRKHETPVADGVAGAATISADAQSLIHGGSTDMHDDVISAQNSVYLRDARTFGSVQVENDLHQRFCSGCDHDKIVSEQDHIATMIKSMKRQITVAEFRFAYAGYAARQALSAVHD